MNTLNLENKENKENKESKEDKLVNLFRENAKTSLKQNMLLYLLEQVAKEFSVASELITPPYLEQTFNEGSHNLEEVDETSLAEIKRLKTELKAHINDYVVAMTKQVVVVLATDKNLASELTANAK